MIDKKLEKKNGNEDLNNIFCPSCFSKLVFKSLNKNEQLLACSNLDCLFPMNCENMNKYIFDVKRDDLTRFLYNLKNTISEQSCIADTNIEEKLKKYKSDEFEDKNDEFSENLIEIQSNSFLLSQNDLFSN